MQINHHRFPKLQFFMKLSCHLNQALHRVSSLLVSPHLGFPAASYFRAKIFWRSSPLGILTNRRLSTSGALNYPFKANYRGPETLGFWISELIHLHNETNGTLRICVHHKNISSVSSRNICGILSHLPCDHFASNYQI